MNFALKTPRSGFVLLVEDQESDAKLTSLALKKNGLTDEILHFSNGYTALDFLFARGEFVERDARQKPRLIILDIEMPKMNGIEVLKTIRDHNLCRRVPIVMLSSSEEDEDIIACYELGVNSFITKPLVFTEYMDKVSMLANYWLRRNRA